MEQRQFGIGRILHLKSRDPKYGNRTPHKMAVQSVISDFGFEMLGSSNFAILPHLKRGFDRQLDSQAPAGPLISSGLPHFAASSSNQERRYVGRIITPVRIDNATHPNQSLRSRLCHSLHHGKTGRVQEFFQSPPAIQFQISHPRRNFTSANDARLEDIRRRALFAAGRDWSMDRLKSQSLTHHVLFNRTERGACGRVARRPNNRFPRRSRGKNKRRQVECPLLKGLHWIDRQRSAARDL
jgi:hypothetical protein